MTVPVWGCPWHGRVRGGNLQLPNSQNMVWPQPPARYDVIGGSTLAMPDTWGIAHRLAVPGVPAPVRTAEEQADDTAAGRQWRNEAILSGARQQLYGRTLDGWIYIDPDGARWLVRCPAVVETTLFQLGTPLSITVTLTRFGELGGQTEVHEYQVSSGWGLGSQSGAISSGRIMLDAIRPNGSAAIIMLHGRTYSSGARIISREPYSFLELSITGPGASATVSLTVARTWDQINQIGPAPVALQYNGSVNYASGGGQRTTRKTLAVWYDASGAQLDLELRMVGDYTYAIPEYAWTGVFHGESQAALQLQLTLGGAVVDSIGAAFFVSAEIVGGQVVYEHSVSVDGVTMSGTASVHYNGTNPPYPGVHILGCLPGDDRAISPSAPWVLAVAPSLNSDLGWGSIYYADVRPYPYSRQVIGLEIMTNNGAYGAAPRNWKRRPPVTPSGLASGMPQTATTTAPAQYYGAWDPYSGACAWHETNPVCYV